MDLKDEILSAFRSVPYPGDDRITGHSCPECDEIAGYFRGTGQTGHTVDGLWEHEAALSLFSDEAFHYWLPSFMLAVLESPENSGNISDRVLRKFGPPESSEFADLDDPEGRISRVRRLDPEQRRAVVSFFRECVRRDIFQATEIEAPVGLLLAPDADT